MRRRLSPLRGSLAACYMYPFPSSKYPAFPLAASTTPPSMANGKCHLTYRPTAMAIAILYGCLYKGSAPFGVGLLKLRNASIRASQTPEPPPSAALTTKGRGDGECRKLADWYPNHLRWGSPSRGCAVL